MVCMADEPAAECFIRNTIPGTEKNKDTVVVRPSMTAGELVDEVGRRFGYETDKFALILQTKMNEGKTITLSEIREKTCQEAGINFELGARNLLIVSQTFKYSPRRKAAIVTEGEDDLLLGASASPTAGEPSQNPPPPGIFYSSDYPAYGGVTYVRHDEANYVGLVNQAMTCYLNSLLQALFMTPEFRNALYNWEFDGSDEVKSIPYQLQKLFLQLQTSNKVAVETKDLTKSFGWDSSEAWQQHDIQELCRVMFDALEQKFKNTKQADLINRLYEGKMIDYVKCLECGTEKQREDTFLDIPLPVRPYGSTVAYGSVEEALRAFVQPETLDGNDQYFCEKCNKKCDAHKGLKFSKFPYLLTLHLKRFDFDYNTLHRIKLNDKVVFPETLNLNSFVSSKNKDDVEAEEAVVKCDDCSTTDSGSALDEDSCQGTDTTAASTNHDIDYQDDDEGIDMSTGANHHENEKNRRHVAEAGPYMYELFSIMIHSGSASGGHYYAYIKDFKKQEWFCFNDQSVSRITLDDIRKTYGGGPLRGYYSGAFSSSTNAYMLMYRQIDTQRNCEAITSENFPSHIQDLLKKMKEREENDRVIQENEMRRCQLKLYAHHPIQDSIVEAKLTVFRETTLAEATKEAWSRLNFEDVVPLERCRLVSYEHIQDTIECSFDGRENDDMNDIINSLKCNYKNDFLLEIRGEDEQFEVYRPGGLSLKVYLVDIETELVDGPAIIRGNLSHTVEEYKQIVAKTLDLDPQTIKLVVEKYAEEHQPLENNERTLKAEGIYSGCKLYAAKAFDEDSKKPFASSKLNHIIDQFEFVISLQITLPEVNKETLEALSIPPLDINHNADKQHVEIDDGSGEPAVATPTSSIPPIPVVPISVPSSDSPVFHRASPLPVEVGSDQSNSEDSSLSDSDRTLVGDVPDEDGLAQLSVSSMSPCVSSPEESNKLEENWDECPMKVLPKKRIHYFKATELTTTERKQNHKTRVLKTLIDKRMSLAQLKKDLEPIVGVPMDYFKVYRHYMTLQEQECVVLSEDFKTYSDREKLGIKLGRALRNGEYAGKVYQLLPNEPEPVKYLCEWIIAKGATIAEVKKSLLEELKRQNLTEIPYERCRLRKKNLKNPGKVYLDDNRFDHDINFRSNWDIFMQELNEPEIVTSSDQIILFVRHWCPSMLELKPFREIVLEESTMEELKRKLSSLSGIPVENIEICKAKGVFPNEMNILSLQTDPEWNANMSAMDKWSLFDDGNVLLYRDNREELKQLSSEERKELRNRETARINKLGSSLSSYSPRRERGLKIYLDSPKKDDDTEVD